jgi:hypothetical protein
VDAVSLGIDAVTTAVGQSGLTGDQALSGRTDFAFFTGISTRTTVGAVCLDIDAVSAAIGQSGLAGDLALTSRADFTGLASFFTGSTMRPI